MYWLDTAILVVVGVAAVLGARTGLVGQVARLVALVVAVLAAVYGNEATAAWLQQTFLAEAPALVPRLVAYLAVFVLVYSVLWGFASLLERGVRAANVQWLNRMMGALLGAGKAALLLGIAVWAANAFLPETVGKHLEKSAGASALEDGVVRLWEAVPEEYRDAVWSRVKPIEDELPDLESLPVRLND